MSVLGVYMAALLWIGWWASKRVSNEADFLVAGRSLGIPLTIGALVATWYGAGTTMGAAGAAYLFGTQGVVFDPYGAALCLLLIGLVFGRIVRRSKYMTLVDYFKSRYNAPVATISGFIMVIAEMGWVGALLVGFGSIIEFFTGIPLGWGIGISTLVLVVYTFLGGMYAITLTDALQMAVITISMIAILMIVMSLPEVGGWSYIFANDASHNWAGVNQWDFFPTSEANADPEFENAGFVYYTGHMGWFYWLAAVMAIGVGLPGRAGRQPAPDVGQEREHQRLCGHPQRVHLPGHGHDPGVPGHGRFRALSRPGFGSDSEIRCC